MDDRIINNPETLRRSGAKAQGYPAEPPGGASEARGGGGEAGTPPMICPGREKHEIGTKKAQCLDITKIEDDKNMGKRDQSTAILEALHEIRADLKQVKKRLSINDHDHDHQDERIKDHDQVIHLIRSELISFGIDPDEYDLLEGIRSCKYYLKHRWRFTNPKAYLQKSLAKFIRRSHPPLVGKTLKHLPGENGEPEEITQEARDRLAERFPQFKEILQKRKDVTQ